MQRITEIGVLSLGKTMGAVGVLIGLIIGVIYGVILGIIGAVTMGSGEEEGFVFLIGAVVAACGFPIAYGLMSFIMGLLYALVLNFVFRRTGGLEIRIEGPED